MFGKGARDEVDEEEGILLASQMREEMRKELRRLEGDKSML